VALGAVEPPIVSALVEFDRRRVDVETFEQLAQHFVLDGDEVGMGVTFHRFEVSAHPRAGSEGIDLLAQVFKGSCASLGAVRTKWPAAAYGGWVRLFGTVHSHNVY